MAIDPVAVREILSPHVDGLAANDFGVSMDKDGKFGTLFFIQNHADIRDIKNRLKMAKEANLHAGFLVDEDLIPDEWTKNGHIGTPPNFLLGIHAVSWGKIYVYEHLSSGEPTIGILHLEKTEYGEKIAMWYPDDLYISVKMESYNSSSSLVAGKWNILTLGGRAWWKNAAEQQWVRNTVEQNYQARATGQRNERVNFNYEDFQREAYEQFSREQFEQFWQREQRSQNYSAPKNSLTASCDVLGIKPGEQYEVARAEYRKLARKYHPDLNQGAEAEAKMKEINLAWEYVCSVYEWRK